MHGQIDDWVCTRYTDSHATYLSYLKAWVVTNDRWTDHGRHSREAREAGLPESSWATRHPYRNSP